MHLPFRLCRPSLSPSASFVVGFLIYCITQLFAIEQLRDRCVRRSARGISGGTQWLSRSRPPAARANDASISSIASSIGITAEGASADR